MSARVSALVLLVAIAACDSSRPKGPQQSDPEALRYAAPMTAGQSLYIRNGRGSITVEPSADDSVRVHGTLLWRGDSRRPDGVVLTVGSVSDGALVCAQFEGGSCTTGDYQIKSNRLNIFGDLDVKVDFVVQVPTGVRLDLIGVDTRMLSASTAPVKARTVNGSITVVTSVGPVHAGTVNGSVDARMTTLSGSDSVVAKSLNGDAWVFLPEAAAVTVDAATTNGRLVTDFPAFVSGSSSRKSLTGTLNGGGTPVRIRTLNGKVGLGRLDSLGRSSLQP